MNDVRGVPVSADDPECLAAYDQALEAFNTYRGNPMDALAPALEEHPDFVMGHVLQGHVAVSMWERSVVPDVAATVRTLHALADRSNDRERAHTRALEQWVEGDWNGMRATLDRLLVDHPRDLLALQAGHLADFYHGDRDNLRGRVARALPAWDPSVAGYGYVLGMYSFGLEECGDYRAAEQVGREALATQPDDCWAHHAVTHVLEMETRQDDGIAFMEERRPHWAHDDNGFAFHNAWHLALFHLDQMRPAVALEMFDQAVHPEPTGVQLMLCDAVALLWRLQLHGFDVGSRWDEIAATYEQSGEAGFYAFNDMHAAMAYTAVGRSADTAALIRAAEHAADGSGTNAAMVHQVGLPVLQAIDAFGRGDHETVVDLLLPVRYRAHAFGGSHAQRDIIHRTLLEAAIRGGDRALAVALSGERAALRPHCAFTTEQVRRAAALA